MIVIALTENLRNLQVGFEPLMTLHALTTEVQNTFC